MACAARGVDLRPIGFDSGLAAYLLNPTLARYDLPAVSLTHLGEGHDDAPADDRGASLFDDLDLEHNARVGGRGAELVFRLCRLFAPYLERRGLSDLLRHVELPLVPVISRMERAGIALDSEQLASLGTELTAKAREHHDRIQQLAGEPFNPDSPTQLAQVLFDRLGLPSNRRTGASARSTNADVLRELSHLHELPAEVLAYRRYVKLNNTYAEALPRLVDAKTRRLHTRFNQVGTATGRLSSEHPNLQNVPIRTALGRRVRSAFVAAPGKRLVAADYSQVELRILAHVSGDEALREAFLAGQDIHRAVAARIAGVPEDEIDSDARRRAKTVNFGIIYGQTPIGLARELDISRAEAEAFIETYFERLPQVKAYIDETIARARREGDVRTLMGRVRPVPEINSRRYFRRAFAERTAVNTVIQGTAADLIKRAMIDTSKRLDREALPAQLLLSIHDELVFEVEPDAEPALAELVREEMVAAGTREPLALDVPLVVDLGSGVDWLTAGKGSLPPVAEDDDLDLAGYALFAEPLEEAAQ